MLFEARRSIQGMGEVETNILMSHHSMSKREKWARAEEIHQALVVKCQTSQQVYAEKAKNQARKAEKQALKMHLDHLVTPYTLAKEDELYEKRLQKRFSQGGK